MKKIKGFTLIEVLVALTIIGILMTFVGPYILDRPDQARKLKLKNDFLAIETAMELYKLDNGTYPSPEAGLNDLISQNDGGNSYFSTIPTDPWGNKYILEIEIGSQDFTILSIGPDAIRSPDENGDDIDNKTID
ncbi:type II secretion system major pseudopilin GspG [Amylibacter sp.]|nr:type II secretion system major pseudopilin GspG [Amylibacter sp.]